MISEEKIKINKLIIGNLVVFSVILFVILSAIFIAPTKEIYASNISPISDTLSTSRPNMNSNHSILFTNINNIEASGKIIITPQNGIFNIPAGLDYTDIDFLDDGTNQVLAPTPGSGAGSAVGMSVTSGTSGNITLTLNDTDAVAAGSIITLRIGTNATFGGNGNQQIQNSSSVGSYKINIETRKANDDVIDTGTTHVFIIEGVDVSTSVGSEAAPPGGGGAPPGYAETKVIFQGRAYPLSKVTVLKDGQLAISSIAGPDAKFDITLSGLSGGSYTFSVFGEDSAQRKSTPFTFQSILALGTATTISGIFLSPTIDVDKAEVRKGENIAIFGQSQPNSNITISVNSNNELFLQTDADSIGAYLYNLDTTVLDLGQHETKSKSALNGELSDFSYSVGFIVGDKTIDRKDFCGRADLNCDGAVNLIDFSIAAFWYKRSFNASFAQIEMELLNGDGVINLVDFSIMAFYWTG